jgi:hypothetical protein
MTASPRMRRRIRPAQHLRGGEAPVRVSFEPGGSAKQTFAIRGHVVDLVNDAEEDEEGSR